MLRMLYIESTVTVALLASTQGYHSPSIPPKSSMGSLVKPIKGLLWSANFIPSITGVVPRWNFHKYILRHISVQESIFDIETVQLPIKVCSQGEDGSHCLNFHHWSKCLLIIDPICLGVSFCNLLIYNGRVYHQIDISPSISTCNSLPSYPSIFAASPKSHFFLMYSSLQRSVSFIYRSSVSTCNSRPSYPSIFQPSPESHFF